MDLLRVSLCIVLLTTMAYAGTNKTANQIKTAPGSKIDYTTAGEEALHNFEIKHVRYELTCLASDSFEGRETTEPGQIKAADFIAEQFKSYGLKPLGDNGTFLQHFPVTAHYVSDSSFIEANGINFLNNKDFFVMPFGAGDASISAPVVFAGYGFENDTYSDYRNVDVKDKIVLLLNGNPSFADASDIMVGSELYKRSNALKHGAAAVLIIASGDEFSKVRQRYASMFGNKNMTLDSAKKEPSHNFSMQMVYIKDEIANELLKTKGAGLNELIKEINTLKAPASMELGNATINLHLVSELRLAENVIGMLEGTDSLLKNEYVVYSAHYDHLGKTPDGIIYHGADDNASGTSTVLGIAETYSKSKVRPKRTIIFLVVSGEEKGLLGSEYFTSHPTVPIKNIVTDLNTDMDGRIDTSYANRDSNYVFVIGSNRLSRELDSIMVTADSQTVRLKLDYSFDSDNDPNQFYYRSDHYNFAKKNIPIVFFFDGNHPDYHKPTDTSDKINFSILEERAKLIFMTGWEVANLDWRLRLN